MEIIWARLTSGAVDGLSYIIGGYVEKNGYQLGLTYYNDIMSIMSKLGLTSTQYVSLGEEIATNLLGERYNGERAAVYYVGELYYNFGLVGVLLGSIAIGYMLQFLYITTLRSRKDIIFISMFGFTTAAFNSILGGPVLANMLDYFMTILVFFIMFFCVNIVLGFSNWRIYVSGKWYKV